MTTSDVPQAASYTMTDAGITISLSDGTVYLPPPTVGALMDVHPKQWMRFINGMEAERLRGFPERVARYAEWFQRRDLHVACFEYSA